MKNKHFISCLLIAVLVAAGFGLAGCKLREKKHQISLATGAVVNAMAMTNPLGVLFGNNARGDASQAGGMQSFALFNGCPVLNLKLAVIPGSIFSQEITISYDPGCIVHGIAMSGSVAGTWSVKVADNESLFYLETNLTIDNLTMEGLVTDGAIHQLLYVDKDGPYALIDGDITTTHADGRTRSMDYDNLTSRIDLSNTLLTLLHCDNGTGIEVPSLIIDGSATYTDEDGRVYAAEFTDVTQPFLCPFPVSGTLHLVNDAEGLDALIDYGDGECDFIITITINGETTRVDVSRWLNRRQYRF